MTIRDNISRILDVHFIFLVDIIGYFYGTSRVIFSFSADILV